MFVRRLSYPLKTRRPPSKEDMVRSLCNDMSQKVLWRFGVSRAVTRVVGEVTHKVPRNDESLESRSLSVCLTAFRSLSTHPSLFLLLFPSTFVQQASSSHHSFPLFTSIYRHGKCLKPSSFWRLDSRTRPRTGFAPNFRRSKTTPEQQFFDQNSESTTHAIISTTRYKH